MTDEIYDVRFHGEIVAVYPDQLFLRHAEADGLIKVHLPYRVQCEKGEAVTVYGLFSEEESGEINCIMADKIYRHGTTERLL